SPFVTFSGSIGVDGADAIMNMVVLTAALSSLNAGLYSTGRIMRSMSLNGSAPKFAAHMNSAGVPYGGILMTAAVALTSVGLNARKAPSPITGGHNGITVSDSSSLSPRVTLVETGIST